MVYKAAEASTDWNLKLNCSSLCYLRVERKECLLNFDSIKLWLNCIDLAAWKNVAVNSKIILQIFLAK